MGNLGLQFRQMIYSIVKTMLGANCHGRIPIRTPTHYSEAKISRHASFYSGSAGCALEEVNSRRKRRSTLASVCGGSHPLFFLKWSLNRCSWADCAEISHSLCDLCTTSGFFFYRFSSGHGVMMSREEQLPADVSLSSCFK